VLTYLVRELCVLSAARAPECNAQHFRLDPPESGHHRRLCPYNMEAQVAHLTAIVSRFGKWFGIKLTGGAERQVLNGRPRLGGCGRASASNDTAGSTRPRPGRSFTPKLPKPATFRRPQGEPTPRNWVHSVEHLAWQVMLS